MGIFNFFKKNSETDSDALTFDPNARVVGDSPAQNGALSVYKPKGYGDVEKMIDELKMGKQVLFHTTELKTSTAVRVLDLLSGAIYALGGGIVELQKGMYILNPKGIETK